MSLAEQQQPLEQRVPDFETFVRATFEAGGPPKPKKKAKAKKRKVAKRG